MQAVSQSDRRMDKYYAGATNENTTQTLHKTLSILKIVSLLVEFVLVLDTIDPGLAKS